MPRAEDRAGTAAGGAPGAPAVRAWWAEQAQAVAAALGTDLERGLTGDEAQRRLREYGPNLLREVRPRSGWRILADQLAGSITVLLGAAAVAAFAVGDRGEGAAIVIVLCINATIGFVVERHAVRSMEGLRSLGQKQATVRRSGALARVAAIELVPGDLVALEAGDVLAADLRLVAGSRLQADESLLTGESLPVAKRPQAVAPGTPLQERGCMLFKGTALTRGTGEGLVVATGQETEVGRIASLVAQAGETESPLEQRLERLTHRLIWVTTAIAALIGTALVVTGRGLYLAVETGIALAVATIPEGLPIVATLALARGMWRLSRRNALIENLAAVETLGTTTVVMVDKTGTLTENRMTAVELRLERGQVRIEGSEAAAAGRFLLGEELLRPQDCADLLEALRAGVLCNNAELRGPSGEHGAVGDPTEVALLVAGARAGLSRAALLRAYPEVREFAFDPESKRMATLHRGDGALLAAVKGAPEVLLERCATVRAGDGSRPLPEAERAAWLEQAGHMAAGGQRVLALAQARVPAPEDFRFEQLELLGLVGLFDPPRERVRAAVETCRAAGIRVVMVTGDHGATAAAVAAAVGLAEVGAAFVDARELDFGALEPPEEQRLLEAAVIARATPSQKLELIGLHQRHGQVVAMTGDGVNDAPALKQADIGIAMGLGGTQVAREAADMVLRDDELGSVVEAVAQGRAIVSNIRKFVVYLMSCNASEVLLVAAGVFAQGPPLLLPLQILFLNLITDVFPALALGACEGSPAQLRRPPRDPREPLLQKRHWRRIGMLGGAMALAVIAADRAGSAWLGTADRTASTLTFLTLALAQLWHVFSMREPGSGWLRNEVTGNPWVWGALALCIALLGLGVHWAPLADALSLAPPGPSGWALAGAFSLLPLVGGQWSLGRARARRTSKAADGPRS